MLDYPPEVARPTRSLSRKEGIEVLVLKCLAIAFALTCIGCGLGIQHIAHTRQKHALCRQLRQKEVELRGVTQAYRALESRLVAKAAADFRRIEACPVAVKPTARKVATRS